MDPKWVTQDSINCEQDGDCKVDADAFWEDVYRDVLRRAYYSGKS